jgi:hypothetical protein
MKLPTVTQAFLIHFGVSLAVFGVLVAIMVFSWFPGNLFFMEGGLEGLKIIAPIDLILGPALTLAFYRPWKKSVKLDMALIVTVQIAALGYGVYAAHGQRTAAIVYAQGDFGTSRFETVSYSEYKDAGKINLDKGRPVKSIDDFGGKMPIVVYAEPFTGDDARKNLEDMLNGGLELRERSDRYRPLADMPDDLANALATGDTGVTEVPASSKSANRPDKLSAPLKARFGSGELTVNVATGKIMRITRLDE